MQRTFLDMIIYIFLIVSFSLAIAAESNPVAADNKNVSLSLSGQVNRALLYIYDGEPR